VTSSAISDVAAGILADFARAGSEAPFFLWLHYFDPHFSYVRHPEVGFAEPYSSQLGTRIQAKRLKRLRMRGELTDEQEAHLRELGYVE
jgi:hypothetical protein